MIDEAHSKEIEDVRERVAKHEGQTQRDFITLLEALDEMRRQRDLWKDRFEALARVKREE